MSLRDPSTGLAIIDASLLTQASELRGLKDVFQNANGQCMVHYVSVVDKMNHRGGLQDRVLVITPESVMLCDKSHATRCFPILDVLKVIVFVDGFIVMRVAREHDMAVRLRDARELDYVVNIMSVCYFYQHRSPRSQKQQQQQQPELPVQRVDEVLEFKRHVAALKINLTKQRGYTTKVIPVPALPWTEVSRQHAGGGVPALAQHSAMTTAATATAPQDDDDAYNVVAPLSHPLPGPQQQDTYNSNNGFVPPPGRPPTMSEPRSQSPHTGDNGTASERPLSTHPLLIPTQQQQSPMNTRAVVSRGVLGGCSEEIRSLREKQRSLHDEQTAQISLLESALHGSVKTASLPMPPPPPPPPPATTTTSSLDFGVGRMVVPASLAASPSSRGARSPVASYHGGTKSLVVVPGPSVRSSGSLPRSVSYDAPMSSLVAQAGAAATSTNVDTEKQKMMMGVIQDEVLTLRKELHDAVETMRHESLTVLSRDVEINTLREELARAKAQATHVTTSRISKSQTPSPAPVAVSEQQNSSDRTTAIPLQDDAISDANKMDPYGSVSAEPTYAPLPTTATTTVADVTSTADYYIQSLPPRERLEIRKKQLKEKRRQMNTTTEAASYDPAVVSRLQAELIALIRAMECDVQEISTTSAPSVSLSGADDSSSPPPPPPPPPVPTSVPTDGPGAVDGVSREDLYAGWYEYWTRRSGGVVAAAAAAAPDSHNHPHTHTNQLLAQRPRGIIGGVSGGGGGVLTPRTKLLRNAPAAYLLANPSPAKRTPFR
eukprot:PhM_4_TR18930/c0_g1_i1/m.12522